MRTLGLFALIISLVPTIFLVPMVMNPPAIVAADRNDPGVITIHFAAGFYPIKFQVLMVLSLALLVPVVTAVFADVRSLWVPLVLPALAYLGVSTLSTIFSEAPLNSLVGGRYDGLLYLIAAVLLFYASVRFLDSWARVRAFLMAGVAAAALISIYGIAQQFGLDPVIELFGVPWQDTTRVFATMQHAVHLAAYTTLMMGATLALYFSTRRRWERGVWLVALAILGACWLYTYTRGAMLGLGVALPVVLVLAYQRMGTVRPMLLPIGVLAAAMAAAFLASPVTLGFVDLFGSVRIASAGLVIMLVVAIVTALPWVLYRRYGSVRPLLFGLAGVLAVAAVAAYFLVPRPLTLGSMFGVEGTAQKAELDPIESRDMSVYTRLLMWRDTLPMIADRPLLGHGPDSFGEAFPPYAGEELRVYYPATTTLDKPHNEFFQVAATTGLLGLAAYVWLFVAYFRAAYRSGGWMLLAISGGVLAYIIQLQAAYTTIANGVTFWALLGVSVAVMRLRERSPEEAAEIEVSDRPSASPAAK